MEQIATIRLLLGAMMVVAIFGSGCTDEVSRTVTLEPAVQLPTGDAYVVGDSLSVHFDPGYSLAGTNHFVAWVSDGSETTRVGSLDSADSLTVSAADIGVELDQIHEVLITEEEDQDSPSSEPSDVVVLQGPLHHEMSFGGLSVDDFASSMGTAELQDQQISVSAMGLPDLPNDYYYGVWLMFGAEDEGGGGHDHGGGDGGDSMEMVFLGQLGGGTFLENEGDRLLATCHSVTITIESDNGGSMMSSNIAMLGAMTLPESAGDGSHGEHMH